ncbi:MAG TPA: hypothetical protein ENN80_03475 [Candidatus Hydrogenedentes bacterium]|nr:hypothetical protein [Candidatus Hydrogenedentota bacterium]
MEESHGVPGHAKTLGWYFRKAMREANGRRPFSFYLLLVIPVVLILAAPVFYTRDDPKRFALHLSLVFLFLFVIVLRALADMVDIGRRHVAERREVWNEALGGGRLGGRSERPADVEGDES